MKIHDNESVLEDFQAPVEQIVVYSRQDKFNYPYFSDLVDWGTNTFLYQFSEVPKKDILFQKGGFENLVYSPRAQPSYHQIFEMGRKQFGDEYVEAVIRDMEAVGYDVEKIFLSEPKDLNLAPRPDGVYAALSVKEKDLQISVGNHQLSSGMARVLSLLIEINFSIRVSDPACFIIDDVGEGLDFERSIALIEILIEREKNSKIQLIMATNDRFVMNKVPLEYWVVLNRKGANVSGKTFKTHQEEFEEFKYTGLSNFDFFSLNYKEQ